MSIYYLQQLSAPSRERNSEIQIHEITQQQTLHSRRLYQQVGEAWQWLDKLSWSEQQWQEYAEAPNLRTFVGMLNDEEVGYFELLRHDDDSVEVHYFGLQPKFIGQGLGGKFLELCAQCAWEWQAQRVWLHTCDLDHPHALKNYQARGFVIYKVES
ncbi:GNAT family N-acetyltransferase [Aliagarivorans marinus]|uniref:GNAT family N-acetyltransferase n=1 Tax=Aliagarivorans marinus TaxID=561965 RepID=UPI000401A8BE|nr:GNAT family N-acetyltransferase [Aliagarivorans marinus]